MAAKKDQQTRQILMLAETHKLADCERRAYSAEQQVAAFRASNAKLQLRIDELCMKYEPGIRLPFAVNFSTSLCLSEGSLIST